MHLAPPQLNVATKSRLSLVFESGPTARHPFFTMQKVFLALALAGASAHNAIISFEEAVERMGLKDLPREIIKSSLAHHDRPMAELPESFSWQDVDGVNMVTRMRNQHIPTYCESRHRRCARAPRYVAQPAPAARLPPLGPSLSRLPPPAPQRFTPPPSPAALSCGARAD